MKISENNNTNMVIIMVSNSKISEDQSEDNIEPANGGNLVILRYLDDDIMNWSRRSCRSRGVNLPFDLLMT